MPVNACTEDGKPGYKYGDSGACYTYPKGDEKARKAAKRKAILQGAAIEPDGKPKLADADYAEFIKADGELETVDMEGVEILSEGGPYHGSGSPAEGDYFSREDLEGIAKANTELAKEVRPPNKLGHNSKQKLLKNSGLADDEQPAAGWLTNFRVVDGEDGQAKLVADIKAVPKLLAKMFKVGSWRTRSVELSRITAQTKGKAKKKYAAVVTGLAWLGAKAPAVRTLKDWAKMFGGDELEDDVVAMLALDEEPGDEPLKVYSDDPDRIQVEAVRFIDMAKKGEVVWKPDEGLQHLRGLVERALNPGPGYEYRYWVEDVSVGKALVRQSGAGDRSTWVVPFKLADDGTSVDLASSDEWTLARQEWVAVASESAGKLSAAHFSAAVATLAATGFELGDDARDTIRNLLAGGPAGFADTSAAMPETKAKSKTVELNDEQIVALAVTFSIDEADPAKRRDAVMAKLSEVVPAKDPEPDPAKKDEPKDEPATPPAATEPAPVLSAAEAEVLKAKAEKGEKAFEERRIEKRDNAIQLALDDGRIEPAKREFWEKEIDERGESGIALLAEMPVNDEFKRVYGKDNDGLSNEDRSTAEDKEYAAVAATLGIENPLSLQGSGS